MQTGSLYTNKYGCYKREIEPGERMIGLTARKASLRGAVQAESESMQTRGLLTLLPRPFCSILKPATPTRSPKRVPPAGRSAPRPRAVGYRKAGGLEDQALFGASCDGHFCYFFSLFYSWNMKPAIIIQKPGKNSCLEENYNFQIKYEHSK